MTAIDLSGITLPDGWIAKSHVKGEIQISAGSLGGVTVSIDRRSYSPGFGYSRGGRFNSTKTYSGRGWRKALIADAVAYLQGIHSKEIGRVR